MREIFRAYYPPTPDEMAELWADGLIVLDTNALLHLFRYSHRTREDFFKTMVAKQESLWIPHRVGFEFHRLRISTINQQSAAFTEIENLLSKARTQAENALNGYKRHPSLDIGPLRETFTDAITGLIESVKDARNRHETDVLAKKTNDETLEKITNLYDGRVGEPFTEEVLDAVHKEGAARYLKKVPPGFNDARADDHPDQYGDLVLWKQLLAHVESVKKPAIFVTDDQKDDWWYIVEKNRYGARPELVDEYYQSSGQRVHFMTTDRFLDFAKSKIEDISSDSITELETLTRERAKRDTESSNANLQDRLFTTIRSRPSLSHSEAAERLRRLHDFPMFRAASSDLEEARRLHAQAADALRASRNSEAHGDIDEPNRDFDMLELDVQAAAVRESIAQANLSVALREFDRREQDHDPLAFSSHWTQTGLRSFTENAITAARQDDDGADGEGYQLFHGL